MILFDNVDFSINQFPDAPLLGLAMREWVAGRGGRGGQALCSE